MTRIEQLDNFLKESPNDCFLKHALAMEFLKIDDIGKAKKLLEENLHFDPKYIATYYHLGQLLEKLSLPEEAKAVYQAGMEIAKDIGDQHAFGELRSVYEELLY